MFRVGLYLCEVPQVVQTFLGQIHANSVENVPGSNEHFATDHLVLGARVALDIYPVNKRAGALLDFIMHIDQRGTRRRAFRQNYEINITATAVCVRHRLGIIAQLFRRIDAALLHL